MHHLDLFSAQDGDGCTVLHALSYEQSRPVSFCPSLRDLEDVFLKRNGVTIPL